MAYQSSSTGMNIVGYKELLYYHLGNISKVAGHLVLMSEDQVFLRQEPEQAYYQAVRTLDAYLSPYFDDIYRLERKGLFSAFKEEQANKFVFAVNLLACCMQLMFRKQWLLMEDIEVGKRGIEMLDVNDFKKDYREDTPPATVPVTSEEVKVEV